MIKSSSLYKILVLIMVFIGFLPFQTHAENYSSYTYGFASGNAVAAKSPPPYLFEDSISLSELCDVGSAVDFHHGHDGKWYIADSVKSQIIILSENFDYEASLNKLTDKSQLNSPEGVALLSDGNLCIADTGNNSIIISKVSGELINQITLENEEAIRNTFLPIKVAEGIDGQLYAISRNDYTGILEMDKSGKFLGYIGSTNVFYNWIDLFWKRIMTEEQKDKLIQFVPVEYNNLSVDNQGFIFAVSASETESKPLRRINLFGTDILRRNGYVSSVEGDFGFRSAFSDVVSQDNGIYHVLDQRKGRIFTYDPDGYLLHVFGGTGSKSGLSVQPSAIEASKDRIYILDRGTNSILIYRLSEFGRNIITGLDQYRDDDYEESILTWEKVIIQNSNYDLAYSQIGKSLLRLERYREAMDYFILGNFRGDEIVRESGYNKALTVYRRNILMGSWWIFVLTGAVAAAMIVFLREKGISLIPEGKFRTNIKFSMHLLFHPFDGFWDMKREKKGRLGYALAFVGAWIVCNILTKQVTGFLFSETNVSSMDVVSEVRNVILIFVLFSAGNWAVTTLMGGEGNFVDIVMTFGYSCLPISLLGIPLSFLTNILTYSEAGAVTMIKALSVLWFLMLLFFGLMTVHQYSIGKTVTTVLLTIAAMAVISFVGMVFMNMLVKITSFISAVVQEILMRL